MKIEDIIRSNSKLIYKIAGKFYGADKEDLYQAGVLGLIKAYKNFRENGQTQFSTYAYDYIYGEMYQLVNNKTIKLNKEILKLYRLIEKTRFSLAQKMGKVPSNLEIANFLSIPVAKIDDAILAGMQIMSLDAEKEMPIYESIKAEEKTDIDNQILLSESMQMLNAAEREIIKARYYEDLTQSEVARKLSMTQVMVSRYEKKSLSKMQDFISS